MKYPVCYLFVPFLMCMMACTSDEFYEEKLAEDCNDIEKITVVMPQLNVEETISRTSFEMGEYPSHTLLWADKDIIGIYPESGDQVSFQIEGTGTSCTFDGGGWALKSSSSYTAYFPFNRSYYFEDKQALPISMLGQKQVGNNNTEHLGAYDILIAKGKKPTSGSLTFNPERKVAFARMKLKAPKAATWKSITFESNASFATDAIMNLAVETPTVTSTEFSNSVILELENVKTTTENPEIIAYMIFLPVDFTEKSLTVKLKDNEGNVYASDASIVNNRTNFEANGARWINATSFLRTITLSEAGKLSSMLTNEEMMNLTSLRVEGPLNGDDIKLLRQMTGGPGFTDVGVLEKLDLSGASIVSGGGYYYDNESTENNVIGKSMFFQSSKLKQIELPKNIVSIGEGAFQGCSKISTMSVPNSVISISNYAFSNCSDLWVCILPEHIETINNGVFQNCYNLQHFDVPSGVIHINNAAFYGCRSLNDIELPEGLTYIGESAFQGCYGLNSITIPDKVTTIGDYAFEGCSALSNSLVIPSDVHTLGEYAFYGCSKLPSVTILGNVSYTGVGEYAFAYCSSLSSAVLSDNISTIGRYAFYCCDELTSITLPENLKAIKDYTFQGCSSLSTLTIPAKVESIGMYAFQSASSQLTKVYSLPTTPPSVGQGCFDSSIYSKCKLYVPTNSVSTYKTKTYWKSFSSIEGIN